MRFATMALAAFALLLAGCAGSAQQAAQAPSTQQGAQSPAATDNAAASMTAGAPAAPPGITLAVLSAHNVKADCWMAISGSVYDLSSFSNHPGGEAYVPYCGTDATAAYETKGGRGKPHSSAAMAMLPQFRVGAFAG